MHNKIVLDELLSTAARDLFADMGFQIEASSNAAALECVAVIGFAGEGIRGALGLGLATPVRDRITPEGADGEDWHAELANQLIGRVKNKLLRYGAPIQVALPMVLRGMRLEFGTHSGQLLTTTFEHPMGKCVAWLDVRVDPGVPFELDDSPEAQPVAEGSEILF